MTDIYDQQVFALVLTLLRPNWARLLKDFGEYCDQLVVRVYRGSRCCTTHFLPNENMNSGSAYLYVSRVG